MKRQHSAIHAVSSRDEEEGMGKTRWRRKTRNLIWGAILATGIVVNSLSFAFGEATSRPAFDQVTTGMAMARVTQLMGVPNDIKRDGESTTLGYGGLKRNKWCTMQVFLGPDGRVKGKFHDH